MDEKTLQLLKAVWAAGFRTGRDNGADAATSFECGHRSMKPQDPEKAWAEEVDWKLIGFEVDMTDPKNWADIP